jgi:hypothetical protein
MKTGPFSLEKERGFGISAFGAGQSLVGGGGRFSSAVAERGRGVLVK